MKKFIWVRLLKGSMPGEVFIFCDDKFETGTIKVVINGEMGDPPGLHQHETAIYFYLTPDTKYKTFEEFAEWFKRPLKQMGFKPYEDYEYYYVREISE